MKQPIAESGNFKVFDDGEANFYTIMKGNNWFAKIQLNGEIHSVTQEKYLEAMIKVLEQCQ